MFQIFTSNFLVKVLLDFKAITEVMQSLSETREELNENLKKVDTAKSERPQATEVNQICTIAKSNLDFPKEKNIPASKSNKTDTTKTILAKNVFFFSPSICPGASTQENYEEISKKF